MQFNTVEFRKALSQFTTGVTVVSTFQGDDRRPEVKYRVLYMWWNSSRVR